MPIRDARMEDISAMLEIYRPYVTDTAITFEYEPPTREAFAVRFRAVTARCPWLLWEQDGEVLGYACAAPAFEKAAYAWCADVTVYLKQSARGRGLGAALYAALEERLRAQGYQILYALVTADNEASLRFHEKQGYQRIGTLPDAGWKLGSWHSVCWLQKRIARYEPSGFPKTNQGKP